MADESSNAQRVSVRPARRTFESLRTNVCLNKSWSVTHAKKRIMSFRVAVASLKLWLDEISVDVLLEFSLQRGLRELVS